MSSTLGEDLAGDLDRHFPDLVDEHGSLVLTLATRLTDTTTAEDITQEVFLRAYRALAGYATDRVATLELRPWLATITRNLVRNEYRRRQRRPTVALGGADGAIPDVADRTLDAIVADDRVNAMLGELSDAQREAVVLRHVVGLPMREVALTMACPVGTAKSHVSRGLGRLRHLVGEPAGLGEREAT